MLKVWSVCALLYLALPFQPLERQFTVFGASMLTAFIACFCIGTLAINTKSTTPPCVPFDEMNFMRVDQLLSATSVITVLCMLLDIQGKSVFDLDESYAARSGQASALMEGAASSSSMAFQIGFLTYPASYIYLVRRIVFDQTLKLGRILVFGILPVLMATLAMGGRAPLIYGILLSAFSFSTRRFLMGRRSNGSARPVRIPKAGARVVALLILGASVYYIVAVFFTRADVAGGVAIMFDYAEAVWGIGFGGIGSDWIREFLGPEIAYLVFVISWYVVQGLLMAGTLFTGYDGPMQFGVYGIDLISALMRRVDGEFVGRSFSELDRLKVYGFLPAAWGSLFVDFRHFGLIIATAWGACAGFAFRQIRAANDLRWLLVSPVLTMGIVFSFINTPLGFANGLVTHLWLIVAFCSIPRVKHPVSIAAPARATAAQPILP